MGADDQATVTTLNDYRGVFRDLVGQHDGRVVDTVGDSVLATFDSVVQAVACAAEIQQSLADRNQNLPEDRRMLFRIGVNLGDVLERDGALYGDGVNIAARLEGLAEPGGLNISGTAFDHVDGKLDIGFEFLGEKEVRTLVEFTY